MEVEGDASTAALRLLSEVSDLLARRDQEQAVSELARLVVPELADWCTVTVPLGEHERRTLGWAHRDPAAEPALAHYAEVQAAEMSEEAAVAVCLRTGEPVVVSRIPPLEQWVPDPEARARLVQLDPASVTVLPLKAAGETLGALALVSMRERGPMGEHDRAVALEVARRAGLALDNARLHEERRQFIETLQRSLLTAPPQTGPLEIAVRYVAAAQRAAVGGDWYDAFTGADGSIALVMGDVVGHDHHAAAAMGQLRGLVRGIGYSLGERPAALLTRVDEAMAGLELDTTATVVAVRVEEPGAVGVPVELSWSSAGHPPPLLVHDGVAAALEDPVPDLLLGLDPATARSESRAVLEPGAVLVLYTDGLVERRAEALDEGIARLGEAVLDLQHLPLEKLADALLGRVLAGSPEDDVALLLARVRDGVHPADG